jgi:hypothetical protein
MKITNKYRERNKGKERVIKRKRYLDLGCFATYMSLEYIQRLELLHHNIYKYILMCVCVCASVCACVCVCVCVCVCACVCVCVCL